MEPLHFDPATASGDDGSGSGSGSILVPVLHSTYTFLLKLSPLSLFRLKLHRQAFFYLGKSAVLHVHEGPD